MPRFKIVIADADVAQAKEIERNVNAQLQQRKPKNDSERTRAEKALRREAEQRYKKRAAGEVHVVADSECPDGLPNCRNCGDPQHAASCAAAGHCPSCGTKHGIAPDSVVAANGYVLVEMTPEEEAAEADAIMDRG